MSQENLYNNLSQNFEREDREGVKILHILPLAILRILLFVHQGKTGYARSQAAGYAG